MSERKSSAVECGLDQVNLKCCQADEYENLHPSVATLLDGHLDLYFIYLLFMRHYCFIDHGNIAS